MTTKTRKISFQGAPGAYSDLACRTVYPDMETLPCESFEDAFNAVIDGQSDLAMIPIDNSLAGRVADVHHLMADGKLYIIGEHFQTIEHNLLGIKGAKKEELQHVHSHIHAIPQCRNLIQDLGLKAHIHADTAGAAAEIAQKNDPAHGAIASSLAAEIYGLDILQKDVHDAHHNTTRFIILATEPETPVFNAKTKVITTLVFGVRNIPAALYKCMGGFATNGLNMTKLESYVDQNFQAARFYCDIEGHIDDPLFKLTLEELGFYAVDVQFMGCYPAHEKRRNITQEYD